MTDLAKINKFIEAMNLFIAEIEKFIKLMNLFIGLMN